MQQIAEYIKQWFTENRGKEQRLAA
jgi:hypothetical protein